MRRRKTKRDPNRVPFIPCGRCIDGLVKREKGGGRIAMAECICMTTWRAQQRAPKPDGKAMAANDR